MRRNMRHYLCAASAALLFTGAAYAQDGKFPEKDIRIIVPTSTGGGMDTGTRQIQPYWEKELGVNVIVDNRPGAGQALGTEMFLRQEPDCYTVLNGLIPVLQLSHMTQDQVDYSYAEDFYPIGSTRQDPTIIRVRNDAPWKTAKELIDDAKSRPGEITVSVGSLTNNQYQAAVTIEDATGAKFNVIPYDGGGPARAALLGGEVNATIAGVYNSHALNDETRVLAVMQDENKWPDLTQNAPTLDEALGIDVPSNQNREGYFVSRECYEQHPDRHKILADTFRAAVENPDFQASLEKVNELGKMRIETPEEFNDWILAETVNIKDFVEKYPEVKGN